MTETPDPRELLARLGLTEKQIDAALNGTLELSQKPIPVKRKIRVYKEYILSRTAICKTCETREVFYFYMTQPVELSGLVSQAITREEYSKTTLPVYHDWFKPSTCRHCLENLLLLQKEDLANMLLRAINEGARGR